MQGHLSQIHKHMEVAAQTRMGEVEKALPQENATGYDKILLELQRLSFLIYI